MCRSQWELVLPRSSIPPACSLTLRHAERPVLPHHTDRLTPVRMSDRGPHGPALHARRGERERNCPHAPPAHSAIAHRA
eukprot:3239109-Prymnesium_polylepis.1